MKRSRNEIVRCLDGIMEAGGRAGALGVFSKTGFHCVSPVHITEHRSTLGPCSLNAIENSNLQCSREK